MAGLILIGLVGLMVVTLIVMASMRSRKKTILKTMGLFFVAIVVLNFSAIWNCGPNEKEVELMKPQAEAISKYILENGLPKSMLEIPNVPYEWDRCERESWNVEYCYFYFYENFYTARLYFLGESYKSIFLYIENEKSETGVSFTVIQELKDGLETNKLVENLKAYSTKDDGLCNPMRM